MTCQTCYGLPWNRDDDPCPSCGEVLQLEKKLEKCAHDTWCPECGQCACGETHDCVGRFSSTPVPERCSLCDKKSTAVYAPGGVRISNKRRLIMTKEAAEMAFGPGVGTIDLTHKPSFDSENFGTVVLPPYGDPA